MRPAGAVEINDTVSYTNEGGQTGYFAAGAPVFTHAQNDEVGQRVALAQIITLRLATQKQMSSALGLARTTLYRQQLRLKKQGVAGLIDQKPGPKAPHRLKPEVLAEAQRRLDEGHAKTAVAKVLKVSEGTIRHAVRQGWLVEKGRASVKEHGTIEGNQPSERNIEDTSAPLGVGTTRMLDRALAARGKITEAKPEFESSLSVANAGALVALPALLELGLLEIGEKVYGRLRNGFYGLRSTLLCLGFMALLADPQPGAHAIRGAGGTWDLAGIGSCAGSEDDPSEA